MASKNKKKPDLFSLRGLPLIMTEPNWYGCGAIPDTKGRQAISPMPQSSPASEKRLTKPLSTFKSMVMDTTNNTKQRIVMILNHSSAMNFATTETAKVAPSFAGCVV
ncbi:hypothetical protein [Pseudomonas petrae]|uniref:Uncharacterized protein n=1 Tax=Pseudomonas petrae TaxID=2912190 RepID=A0ABS9I0L5_9PSED|nr:hypothetical protein [Pseudomonas petrae]MCF7540618.1 hypothetical protein [Pseudomonas petrae]